MTTNIPAAQKGYDQANLASAREIAKHPDQHGGEGSFSVTWARLVLERMGEK